MKKIKSIKEIYALAGKNLSKNNKFYDEKANILREKGRKQIKELLLNFPKETLAEMLTASMERSSNLIFQQYFSRRHGKEMQLKGREFYEKLAEETYRDLLKKQKKVTLNMLADELNARYTDWTWYNNADPDKIIKDAPKDWIRLKAIFSNITKK